MIRRSTPRPEVLLVHRPSYDDWTFPKGKDEPGERPEAAAVREVWEETGYRCRVISAVGESSYPLSTGERKHVRYFAMRPIEGEFRSNGEVDEIRWLRPDEASDLLTYERDKGMLGRLDLERLLRTGTFYLVRHGAAGNRELWEGDDRLRPLSKKGWRQAEGLVSMLAGEGIERLVSSPHLRCRQTFEPLAKLLGLPIEEDEGLTEGAGGEPIHRLLEAIAGTNAALCSHGDVIPALLDRVIQRGLQLESPFDCKKGSVWVVKMEGGEFTTARYVAPPEM